MTFAKPYPPGMPWYKVKARFPTCPSCGEILIKNIHHSEAKQLYVIVPMIILFMTSVYFKGYLWAMQVWAAPFLMLIIYEQWLVRVKLKDWPRWKLP